MTHSDQTALWEVCESQWHRLKTRWGKVNLPAVEWEDIRSVATIRVFHQAWRYDPTKASPETWVRMVMYRSIINSLRAILPSKDSHRWRTAVRCARSIYTRVEQTGRWGEQVVVVEPDMVDEGAVCPRAAMRWDDFVGQLDRDQQIVARERARGCTVENIRKRYFVRQTYPQVYKHCIAIQKRWEEYCT